LVDVFEVGIEFGWRDKWRRNSSNITSKKRLFTLFFFHKYSSQNVYFQLFICGFCGFAIRMANEEWRRALKLYTSSLTEPFLKFSERKIYRLFRDTTE